MSRHRLVNLAVFDIDGTLLNNLAGEDACYAQALREQLALADLDTNWVSYEHVSDDGIATEAYARAYGRAPTAALRTATIEHFVALLRAAHVSSAPLVARRGAHELLAALPACGWAVALATGAWRRAAEYKLAAAGLPVDDVPLATSEDGPARVAIVTRAIARAQAQWGVSEFARVLSIGDGVWDVRAAQDLHLPFVGVGVGPSVDRLRGAGASHIIADYADLEGTLRVFDRGQVPRRVNSREDR
jgi:phosphoglycolate phosphatase-like HAD superfamily hydrolase